jgi:hypothetical protein
MVMGMDAKEQLEGTIYFRKMLSIGMYNRRKKIEDIQKKKNLTLTFVIIK